MRAGTLKKSILYLDQNFISNFAKAESVPDWKDPLKAYFLELLQVLRLKVRQNRLACPTSGFHRDESSQSTRIKDHVWHLVERLCHRLEFNSSSVINMSQLAAAAYAFSGQARAIRPEWTIAFNQDPQQLVDSTSSDGQIMVHLDLQELNDYFRVTTDLVADIYGKFKLSRIGAAGTFEEEVQYQKANLLRETFYPLGKLIEDYPDIAGDLSDIGAVAGTQMQAQLLAIFKECGVMESGEFFASQTLLRCPFLHIRASLMAADIIHYPEMVPTPSLNTDFDIVASTMPYVDILATDSHMAQLIRIARLNTLFQAQVFSMNQRDQLLDDLRTV